MSTLPELIERVQILGARLWVEGNRLELDIPSDFPDTLIERLRENKAGLMTYLRTTEAERSLEVEPTKTCQTGKISVADELERMLALGERLKRGEISAIRCGITGRRCTACQGVPCLGSEPWRDE